MDIERARARLAQRRATMDMLRGRAKTDSEKLGALKWALQHCDKCEGEIDMSDRYCRHCGYDLMGEP